jgi:ribosomal protein L7/L12
MVGLSEPEAVSDDDRLIALVRNGQKIEAIKLYRERTGAGLQAAKDAVEALEQGGPQSALPVVSSGNSNDILVLLRAGQKIAAIKLYRETTGVGLAEAKNAVEALAREHGMPTGQVGCGSSVLSVLMIALVIAYFMF